MTKNTIEITITAKDEAAEVFKALNKIQDKSQKEFKETGAAANSTAKDLDKAAKGANNAKKSAVELASAIEITEKAYEELKNVIGTVQEIAELGAQAERVERRFNKFAEAAGGGTLILEAFQRGAGGAASQMDAMGSASRLLQMGLVQDAASMERVVEMATRLGDQTMTVGDRVSDFALMLSNMSIPRLDNFGISSGKVRARIQELQASVEGMTRETAFMQAVMEQGGNSLEILGERVEDDAMKFEKAQARMADFRVEMGQNLMPVVADITGFISGLESATLAFGIAVASASAMVIKFSGGLKPAIGLVGQLATRLGTSTAALGALGVAAIALVGVYEASNKVLEKYAEGHKQVDQAAKDFDATISDLVKGGESLEDVLSTVASKADEVSEAFENQGALGNIIVDLNIDQAKTLRKVSDAAGQAALTAALQADNVDILRRATEEYNAQLSDQRAALGVVSDAEWESLQSTIKLTEAGFDLADAFIKQGKEARKAASEHAALNAALNAELDAEMLAADGVERHNQVIKEYRDTMQGVFDESGRWIDTSNAVNEVWNQQRDAIDETAESLEEVIPFFDETGEKIRLAIEKRPEEWELLKQEIVAGKNAVYDFGEAAAAQKRVAEKSAAAMALMRDRAAETADKVANLAISLKDATGAQIAQTMIGMLDPKTMGAEAFGTATADIGLAFGIMDEESAALAEALPVLAGLLEDNVIPASSAAEALQAVADAAEDGSVYMPDIVAELGNLPEPLQSSAEMADELGLSMTELADIQTPNAVLGVTEFGGAAETAGEKAYTARDGVEKLGGELTQVAGDYYIDIYVRTHGEVPPVPGGMQMGGVVPGQIGQPRTMTLHGGEIVLNPYQPGALGGPTTNNFNLNISSSAPVEPIISDFRMMQAIVGSR